MGKIIVDGVEFETIGKPKVVPYNSVTKDLLDAHRRAKKKRGKKTETSIIGDEVTLTEFCKTCGENVNEENRGKEYNFLCVNCESLVMKRDDEFSEVHNLSNSIDI